MPKTWTPDGAARVIRARYADELAFLAVGVRVQRERHRIEQRLLAPTVADLQGAVPLGGGLSVVPGHGPMPEDHPAKHRAIVRCVTDPALKVSVILTYEHGTHASGWWRNSDYDRCIHLSLCAVHPDDGYVDLPDMERRAWGRVIFDDNLPKTWTEPPAQEGDDYRIFPASRYTTHVRLFLDRENQPIVPEGEVYTLKPWAEGDSPEKVFRS